MNARARIGVLAVAACVALSAGPALPVSAAGTGGGTCSADSCIAVLAAGFSAPHGIVVRHRHTRVAFTFTVSQAPATAQLIVRQSRHFPIVGEGSVLINGKPAPHGTVTAHRTTLSVQLAGSLIGAGNGNEISFVAAPDGTSRGDQRSTATLTFAGAGGPTRAVSKAVDVPLTRPFIYVHGDRGTPRPRTGHDTGAFFQVMNSSPVAARPADARLTLSSSYSLGHRRHIAWNNHRLRCHGRHRHIHCVLPSVRGNNGALFVPIHAARRLHPGHVGRVTLVVTPRGYDMSAKYDRDTLHIRVGRS